MIRRNFKAKRFGRLVFKDQNGNVICKAGINNNSRTHRDGVIKSVVGMIQANMHYQEESTEHLVGQIRSIEVDRTIERIRIGKEFVLGHP